MGLVAGVYSVWSGRVDLTRRVPSARIAIPGHVFHALPAA
jgi:hypothetical protein